MSKKKWVVELSREERDELSGIVSNGKAAAKKIQKARILLKADAGPLGEAWTDARIAEALDTNVIQVARVRRCLVEDGMTAVLTRKKRETPPRQPVFDGEKEARLVALACTTPPRGYARWTIRLLANKVVEMEIVETVHFNTVGRTLKKTSLNRTGKNTG